MIARQRLPRKLQKISLIQTSSLDEGFLRGLKFSLGESGKTKRMIIAREVLADEIKKANGRLSLIYEDSFSWKEEATHKELAEAKKVYGEVRVPDDEIKYRKIEMEEYNSFIVIDGKIVVFYSGNVGFVFYGGIAELLLELSMLRGELPKRLYRMVDSITSKILVDVDLKEHSKNSCERVDQTLKG
ncbi:MAG: hypothetical protein QXL47_01495 [Candidatus Anstonellales archaeon]